MKTKNLFHLLVCLLTGLSSCNKENDTKSSGGRDIRDDMRLPDDI